MTLALFEEESVFFNVGVRRMNSKNKSNSNPVMFEACQEVLYVSTVYTRDKITEGNYSVMIPNIRGSFASNLMLYSAL